MGSVDVRDRVRAVARRRGLRARARAIAPVVRSARDGCSRRRGDDRYRPGDRMGAGHRGRSAGALGRCDGHAPRVPARIRGTPRAGPDLRDRTDGGRVGLRTDADPRWFERQGVPAGVGHRVRDRARSLPRRAGLGSGDGLRTRRPGGRGIPGPPGAARTCRRTSAAGTTLDVTGRTRKGATMSTREFTEEEALAIGQRIGIDWSAGDVDLEQFRMGLAVELEHGTQDPATDVTHDDETTTGKIALAHLKEIGDYYTRLD